MISLLQNVDAHGNPIPPQRVLDLLSGLHSTWATYYQQTVHALVQTYQQDVNTLVQTHQQNTGGLQQQINDAQDQIVSLIVERIVDEIARQ